MQTLTLNEIDIVSGANGGLSAADGAQLGGVVGAVGGMGAYLTGAAGSLSFEEAVTLGGVLGGAAGIAAVVVAAGGIAAYEWLVKKT